MTRRGNDTVAPVAAPAAGPDWRDYLIYVFGVLLGLVALLILALCIRYCCGLGLPKRKGKAVKDDEGTPAFANALYGVIGNHPRPSISEEPKMAHILSPKYMQDKINPAFDDSLEGASGYSPRLMHKIIIPPSPEGSPLLPKKNLSLVAEIAGVSAQVTEKGSLPGTPVLARTKLSTTGRSSPSLLQQTLVSQTLGAAAAVPAPQVNDTVLLDPSSMMVAQPPPYSPQDPNQSIALGVGSPGTTSDRAPLVNESSDYETLRGTPTKLLHSIRITHSPKQNRRSVLSDDSEEPVYCSIDDIDVQSVRI